jgi:hypothetical protein
MRRAPTERAEARDDEGHKEVQRALDPCRRRVSADDHIELVDRRQRDINDQGNAHRAADAGTPQAAAQRRRESFTHRLAPSRNASGAG